MKKMQWFATIMLVLLMTGAASAVQVTFQVDMSIQEQLGNFDVATDSVGVNGSMNGWDIGNPYRLHDDDGDLVYTTTIDLNAGDFHEYKFVIAPDFNWGSLIWEDLPWGGNRSFTVPDNDGSLDLVFFNDLDTIPMNAEVQFLVDMSVMVTAGSFNPDTDAVVVRGGHPAIGGWGGYLALEPIGNDQYELLVPFNGVTPDVAIEYKFVVDDGNDQQGPDIWEELPGGGNRSFTVTGDEPDDNDNGYLDVWLDMVYFNDNPGGISQEMTLTFELDGRPALRKQDDVGIPGLTEEIEWFIATGPWDDPAWNWSNGTPTNVTLYDDGVAPDEVAGDSMFTAELVLPAGTGLNFVYKYGAMGYDNEGGFGTNHFVELPDQADFTLTDEFGSIDDWYDGYYGDPIYDVTIEELQTNTNAYLDQMVRVTGIVTIPTATVHAGYTDVYIQDDSGYGINLYDSEIDASAGMDRGDEVEVVGVLIQYFDTTEIVDFTFTELSSGNDLPAPITWDSTGDFDMNAVPFEGTWSMLAGTIQDDFSPYDGSYNFSVNSGDGDATVRIWGDTDLDLLDGFAIGDDIVVYGVVDVYNGSPQMMPALLDDVQMADEPGPVVLDLIPVTDVVPANGGQVVYDAELTSNLNQLITGIAYTSYVTLPNGNLYGPIDDIPVNLPPFYNNYFSNRTLDVPAGAPSGAYTFIGRVGFPNMYVEDSFPFTKDGTVAGSFNPDELVSSGLGFEIASDDAVVSLPEEFGLSAAYPNPFNPTTSVAVALPASSELTVAVFNVMGQQVAELAHGKFSAGQHNFSFDASHLSSGLYFIQAQVPGELNAIQKVTLMK